MLTFLAAVECMRIIHRRIAGRAYAKNLGTLCAYLELTDRFAGGNGLSCGSVPTWQMTVRANYRFHSQEPGRSRSFCMLPARLLTAFAIEAEGDLLLFDCQGYCSLLRRLVPPSEVTLRLLGRVALVAALLALAHAHVAVLPAEREVEHAKLLDERSAGGWHFSCQDDARR